MLVILGLLTGGILAGQSLIRASELRSVSTEYSRWVAATQSFRDKYFAIPGDMTNATSFWGAAHATPATCLATVGTGTQTCNGDGDGILDNPALASQYGEDFTYWQHLANAGLIEGSYSGRAGSGSVIDASATNTPRSKLNGGLWFSWNWNSPLSGLSTVFDGTYRDNMLELGGTVAASSPETPLLKPEEVWNIDTKIDDGRPGYGLMRERMWDDCTDAANGAAISASYALTVSTKVCLPMFYNK